MKRFSLGLFIFLLGGCENATQTDVPANLIKKDKLISLIVDLQILESHFQRQFSRVDLYRDALDSSSSLIYQTHNITKNEFKESVDYYAAYPDSLFIIYEAALDTISYRINAIQTK
jgi:hypothetical protein